MLRVHLCMLILFFSWWCLGFCLSRRCLTFSFPSLVGLFQASLPLISSQAKFVVSMSLMKHISKTFPQSLRVLFCIPLQSFVPDIYNKSPFPFFSVSWNAVCRVNICHDFSFSFVYLETNHRTFFTGIFYRISFFFFSVLSVVGADLMSDSFTLLAIFEDFLNCY